MRPRRLAIAAFLIPCFAAPTLSNAQPCDYDPVVEIAQGIVDDAFLVTGASVWIDTPIHSQSTYLGDHTSDTVIAIASASKLVSAVAILTLVDDGLIDLDVALSSYLPQFTGSKGTMTVRQMFSHTSGLPGGSSWGVLSDDTITLAEAANEIACCIDLAAPPGTQFDYGGLSMHVTGRVAEVVTGQDWSTLFAERVAVPLGLANTDYFAFGPTLNPRIAGGVRTSLADYGTILRMLRDGGVFDGVTILSPAAIAEMFADQTFGVPIVGTPAPPGVRYGLGCWRDVVAPDGSAIRISSPGAFGFTPWIELDVDLAGILMVLYSYQQVADDAVAMQEAARSEALTCNPATPRFERGDSNDDSEVDVADVVNLLSYLFDGAGSAPGCLDARDANDDGAVNVADAVRILAYLFGEPSIPLPGPGATCGVDASGDGLGCESYSSCP
ncbi:MAG: serine hydrolase [Planctomycetes bacterium]|nr:serine hydrolase [Planctomycetota bacterium]